MVFILLCILLCSTVSAVIVSPDTISSAVFTKVGVTTQSTAYAHIVNSIDLTSLFQIFGSLHDEYIAVYGDPQAGKTLYETTLDSIDQNEILHKQHFMQLKSVYNKMKIVLKLLYKNRHTDLLQTLDDTNQFKAWLSRNKRQVSIPKLIRLLGFGVGLIKKYSANKIYQQLALPSSTAMVESLPEKSLMIFKSFNYIKNIEKCSCV